MHHCCLPAEGGTITKEDLTDGKITEGENATFTITPNSGYEIADVKLMENP